MNKIDAFHLKVIAIIAMFLNHVGHTFENVSRLPPYIVSFGQCITSLYITNFTITLQPKIGKIVYAISL
ncbi:hypothetical protein [Streptococcus sp. FT1-106]|uniref:hypothetical protein n=1 Tax=Streptococcus sp. FT1-106 TaxID=3409994 RepID=UPI003BF4A963